MSARVIPTTSEKMVVAVVSNVINVEFVVVRQVEYPTSNSYPPQVKQLCLKIYLNGMGLGGVDVDTREKLEPSYSEIGLDVGLNFFYTDDKGNQIENPSFYRLGENALNRYNRRKSKKYVKGKKPQSKNYHKARTRYARKHLKISRQRKDHAVKLSHCVGRVTRLEASGVARCDRHI